MKKYFNIYLMLGLFLALGTLFSCTEEELEKDAGKVVPFIHNFDGPTVAFVEETGTYAVTPFRGGSEYVWTVTGAEVQPVDGRTDKINVYFNQFEELASVSVYEKAANGTTSEVHTIEGIKIFGTPCNWTVEMQDAYGDGWNGASLDFAFDGYAADIVTIDDGASATATVAVPNGSVVDITFTSGDWDSEVTFQVYDADGNLVYSDGPSPTVGVGYSGTNSCP